MSVGQYLLIGLPASGGGFVVLFAVDAMIDESADGNLCGEIGNAADVIGVVVGDEEVVDLFDAGKFADLENVVGAVVIGFAGAGPAGIDEQVFAAGRDEESRLTAFDIGEVDLEVSGSLSGRRRGGLPSTGLRRGIASLNLSCESELVPGLLAGTGMIAQLRRCWLAVA